MSAPNVRDAVASARRADAQLWMRFYCEGSGCPVREFDIRVKDYDQTLLDSVAAIACPICGRRTVTLHWVMTTDQHHEHRASDARCNVNAQRYIRDHGGSQLVAVPASAFADDSLPP